MHSFPSPSARSIPCTPAIGSSIPEAARLIYVAEQNLSMSAQICIYNARNLHAVLVRRYVRSPREIPGRPRLPDSASACSGSVVFDAHSRRERA